MMFVFQGVNILIFCELILVGKVQGTGCIMYHLFPISC